MAVRVWCHSSSSFDAVLTWGSCSGTAAVNSLSPGELKPHRSLTTTFTGRAASQTGDLLLTKEDLGAEKLRQTQKFLLSTPRLNFSPSFPAPQVPPRALSQRGCGHSRDALLPPMPSPAPAQTLLCAAVLKPALSGLSRGCRSSRTHPLPWQQCGCLSVTLPTGSR